VKHRFLRQEGEPPKALFLLPTQRERPKRLFLFQPLPAFSKQRIFPDPDALTEPVITPQNRRLLESAILQRCDARDGVEDGFLNDPRDCDFKLSDLPVCASEAPSDNCLTIRQREAIAAVYGGPRNADGQI